MKAIACLLAISCLVQCVYGDGHLACPSDRACPQTSSPVSYDTSTTCARNEIDSMVHTATQNQVLSYTSINNELFTRFRTKYLGQNYLYSAERCAEIRTEFPSAPSGWYWVSQRRVYCDFDLETPSVSENWERLIQLDMTNPEHNCPSEFRVSQPPEARGRFCVRPTGDNGCTSLILNPAGIGISRVYGRVYGIQIGSADVIDPNNPGDKNIDNDYLDGVSITIGSPRQHVWSFMAYTSESGTGCPCSIGGTNRTLSFIGSDYFCESGTLLDFSAFAGTQEFPDDPLWDGRQCNGFETTCCGSNLVGGAMSPPWFYKELSNSLSSGLELRLCTDQGPHDESIGLQLVELYVQ